jgi:hypothetical protein
MAREKRKEQPAAPPPELRNDALAEFCEKLSARWPNRLIKRFVMPNACIECREVFIGELTSKEEIQASINADVLMSPLERASNRLAADAERREAIRISIVGLGKLAPDGKAVCYSMTNHDGDTFDAVSKWSTKAWAALSAYFGEVNGLPIDEIAQGIMGARPVGAYASPTSETLASADRGR